jgi:transposase InsO family protein
MIAFIDEHRDAYGVEPIWGVLPISPSSYHERLAKRRDPALQSARVRRVEELKPEVLRVFAENFGVYAVRKVWRQMKREGFDVARCTVQRLMGDLGLEGVVQGKPVRTTIADKSVHARSIRPIASSMLRRRTCSGFPTSHMSLPGRVSSPLPP